MIHWYIWLSKFILHTFRFILVHLRFQSFMIFRSSMWLWGGEEVIVEPSSATRGDGVDQGVGCWQGVHLGDDCPSKSNTKWTPQSQRAREQFAMNTLNSLMQVSFSGTFKTGASEQVCTITVTAIIPGVQNNHLLSGSEAVISSQTKVKT